MRRPAVRFGLWALGSGLWVVAGVACTTGRHDVHLVEQRRLEESVSTLTAAMSRLRAELDSLMAQNDSLRRSATRLEADVAEREEQMRAIRLELQRLKEIDFRARKP
ncbi:MAG: hypothetical protein ACRENU_16545 [Gemmatimonadaceae bacterium]